MAAESIRQLLQSPSPENAQALLDDGAAVFWIDWRQEDETIADSCELVLKTGKLSSEMVDVYHNVGGYEIHVRYGTRQAKVPLTFSEADRHLTLCTLNEVLSPDYEIRFCIASNGSDTLGFVPLPLKDWKELEKQFGLETVGRHFYRLNPTPNLFTDPLPF